MTIRYSWCASVNENSTTGHAAVLQDILKTSGARFSHFLHLYSKVAQLIVII